VRHEKEVREFALGLLLALLLSRALRAFLSTLFYESLATLRLNESAYWCLALLAPALAPLLGRHAMRATVALAAVATSALPFARFTDAYVPLGALGSACGLLALARSGTLPGVLTGLALDGALLVLGHAADPLPAWAVALLGLGAILLAFRIAAPPTLGPRGWTGGAAAAALVAAEIAYLASPYAAARWAGIPAWGAALAGGLGLALGATRFRSAGRWVWIAGVLALVDLALARSPFVALSLGLVQLAMGAAGARLAPSLASRGGAIAFAIVLAPLGFVLLYFQSALGVSEWGALVPLLVALACAPAVFAARPAKAPRRLGAVPTGILLALLAIPAALPQTIAEPSADGDIVYVSWNVHQAFGNRGALDPDIYADTLRALDADIVVLQESDTARLSSGHLDIVKFLAAELDMRAAYGRSGVAVLSRFPFADAERPPEDLWTFEVPLDVNGTTLWVHGVHLARGRFADARLDQVAELLADPAPAPHVISGDLNACPVAAGGCFGATPGGVGPYERLTERYQDAWVLAGNDVRDPAGNTHSACNPSRRIDHILVEGITVLEAYPILDERTRLASDHLPVYARLRLGAAAAT
jgi:endonuclease/exonuclease/phosphatase family metal-dependent hydrolase